MTAYSPLRIASSEFGMLSVTLERESKTFPIELVLGIPIYVTTIKQPVPSLGEKDGIIYTRIQLGIVTKQNS